MKIINTGYYQDKSTTVENFLRKYENNSFRIDSDSPYDDAYIFLAGACDIFANSLFEKFHFNMCKLESTNSEDHHYFCMIKIRNKNIYIDVRGMTSSFEEFFSEFKFKMKDGYNIKQIDKYEKNESDEWEQQGKLFANEFIEQHYEWFDSNIYLRNH